MSAGEVKALKSGGSASVNIDMPLRLEPTIGKEIVRDAEGRAQAAIDRTICDLRWDHR